MNIWLAELQRAIYERLLTVPGADVYNVVPQEPTARPPYIVIGAETTELPGPFETQDSAGSDTSTYIHIWDDANGWLRTKRIMAEIDCRLHDAVLDLEGVARAHCRRDFMTTLDEQVDDDAKFWRHGVIRYRCLIHGTVQTP